MKAPTYDQLKDEYSRLWSTSVTRSSFKEAVDKSCQKIIANKARYEDVSGMTNVPWFVVGLIHQMESGCRFTCHLHNGDPLSAKTVHVPKGRPTKGTPVFPWEDSACDALIMHGLNKITEWPIERICYELERYNGWGYRQYHPTTLSPYLWSGTTLYARGKYVEDGKWSSEAVSSQSGAMALLKRLRELDPTILPVAAPVEVPVAKTDSLPSPPVAQETASNSFMKANETQQPLWRKLMAALGFGAVSANMVPSDPLGTAESFMQTGQRVRSVSGQAHDLSGWALSLPHWPVVVAVLALGGGLYWAICHWLPGRQS